MVAVGDDLLTPAHIAAATDRDLTDVRERLSDVIETLGAKDLPHAWALTTVRHGGPIPERLAAVAARHQGLELAPLEVALLEAYLEGVTINGVMKRLGAKNAADACVMAHSLGLLIPKLSDDEREVLHHLLLGHKPEECKEHTSATSASVVIDQRTALFLKFGVEGLAGLVALLITAGQLPPMEKYLPHIERAKQTGFTVEEHQLIAQARMGGARAEMALRLGRSASAVNRLWSGMFETVGLGPIGSRNAQLREGILTAIAFWAGEPVRVPAPDPLLTVRHQRVLCAIGLGLSRPQMVPALGIEFTEVDALIRDLLRIFGAHNQSMVIVRAVKAGALHPPPWQVHLLDALAGEALRSGERQLLGLLAVGQHMTDIKAANVIRNPNGIVSAIGLHMGVDTIENILLLAAVADQITLPEDAEEFALVLADGQPLCEPVEDLATLWAGLGPDAAKVPVAAEATPAEPAEPGSLAEPSTPTEPAEATEPSSVSTTDPSDPAENPGDDPGDGSAAGPASDWLARFAPRQLEVITAWMTCGTDIARRAQLGHLSPDNYSELCDAVLTAASMNHRVQVVARAAREGLEIPEELKMGIEYLARVQPDSPQANRRLFQIWSEAGGIGRIKQETGYNEGHVIKLRGQWKTVGLQSIEMIVAAAVYAGII